MERNGFRNHPQFDSDPQQYIYIYIFYDPKGCHEENIIPRSETPLTFIQTLQWTSMETRGAPFLPFWSLFRSTDPPPYCPAPKGNPSLLDMFSHFYPGVFSENRRSHRGLFCFLRVIPFLIPRLSNHQDFPTKTCGGSLKFSLPLSPWTLSLGRHKKKLARQSWVHRCPL